MLTSRRLMNCSDRARGALAGRVSALQMHGRLAHQLVGREEEVGAAAQPTLRDCPQTQTSRLQVLANGPRKLGYEVQPPQRPNPDESHCLLPHPVKWWKSLPTAQRQGEGDTTR